VWEIKLAEEHYALCNKTAAVAVSNEAMHCHLNLSGGLGISVQHTPFFNFFLLFLILKHVSQNGCHSSTVKPIK